MFEDEEQVEEQNQVEERQRELDSKRKRAAAKQGDAGSVLNPSEKGVAPQNKDGEVLREGPSMDRVVNLEDRSKACIYIPCKLASPQEVWSRVVSAIQCMDTSDFNEVEQAGDEPSYDLFSMKYLYDSFVLARTRLVRLEMEGDGEQIFIELRKLEGDGFAFTDDFQRHLESELEEITEDDERPKPQAKDEVMYLDLVGPEGEEIISNWMRNLRPSSDTKGTGLVYNEIETYKAMSALGWNLTSPENFEFLSGSYKEDILSVAINILGATSHLPTAYFSALTLSEFAKAGELGEAYTTWDTVKLLCEASLHWSEDKNTKFTGMQISRSREVVRLLTSVLMTIGSNLPSEGRDKAAPTIEAFCSKIEELQQDSGDYTVEVSELRSNLSAEATN